MSMGLYKSFSSRIISSFFLVLFFLPAGSLGAIAVSGGVPVAVSCVTTIFNDTNLTEDLLRCRPFGIAFGANNITLDCQGHKITGDGDYGDDHEGVRAYNGINGGVIKNCVFEDFSEGVAFFEADEFRVEDNNFSNNLHGIFMQKSNNNVFSGNIVKGPQVSISHGFKSHFFSSNNLFVENKVTNADYGIVVSYNSNYNVVKSNTLTENRMYGVEIAQNANSNVVFNNFFRNPANAKDSSNSNYWNMEKTPGQNIVGGPYLGGNYWHDYNGMDLDGDGIGDTNTPYDSNGNLVLGDFLPLVQPVYAPSALGTPRRWP